MKKTISFILFLSIKIGSFGQIISISNPLKTERKEIVVTIPWKEILAKYPKIDTDNLKIIDLSSKKEMPFQFEFKGGEKIQNLLVQTSIGANSTVKLNIIKDKPTYILPKTYARFVPERLDDFAWENDKIAFRAYGKALENTQFNAYGLDVWVKRTDRLVINERYKRDKYHIDNGDGLDYYHVGNTLGAGNVSPIVNDSIYYSGNFHRWKILDIGVLRTAFQLEYDEWNVAGMKTTAIKTISLDAGSQMNRIEVAYQFEKPDSLNIVVGIVKRPQLGNMVLDELGGIMAYWEPQHGDDGITGVGTVFLSPITKMTVRNDQLLTHTSIKKGTPYVYYAGAAWNKAKEINNSQQWFNYLKSFKENAENPLIIIVK
jgi:hypothetical protein